MSISTHKKRMRLRCKARHKVKPGPSVKPPETSIFRLLMQAGQSMRGIQKPLEPEVKPKKERQVLRT